MPIQNLPELREHLRLAMQVEMSTVPLYLYALWSIEDQACDAAGMIRSIVAEEMLHLALAANLLVAVGGEPDFVALDLRPAYPSLLASHHPALTLNLAPATPEQVRSTFLVLEQPDPLGSSREHGGYDSLGEFYAAIEEGVVALGPAAFTAVGADRQLSDPRFYGAVAFNSEASGDLMLIDSVERARAAIDVIVHQGEGLNDNKWADEAHQELTHYAKFRQIAEGMSPIGSLRPVPVNPRGAVYPASVRPLSNLFNGVYASVFVLLDALYQPRPKKGALVTRLYLAMRHVLAPIGRELTTMPLPGGGVAAPTFETVDLGTDPAATLAGMAEAVGADHPALAEALAPLIAGQLLPAPAAAPAVPNR